MAKKRIEINMVEMVLFQRTVVLLSFFVFSSLIVKSFASRRSRL